MHPLYGALPEPYVPVSVTRGAVIVHRCTYASPEPRSAAGFLFTVSISVEQSW